MAERNESKDDKNLKQREYRDKQGDVHHHTHEYMERKEGGDDARGSESSEEEGGRGGDR